MLTTIKRGNCAESNVQSRLFEVQVAREIELQASLQHPSIVQIYAAFEDNEGIYVVQEFALGGDLYAQLAQAGGYLAEDQVACEVMVPVLAALGYMHTKVSRLDLAVPLP